MMKKVSSANKVVRKTTGKDIVPNELTAEKRRKRSSVRQTLVQREAELAVINSVQQGLASRLDMRAIYELIGATIRNVFGAHVIDIVDYDAVNHLISMPYSYEEGDRSVIAPREPYGFRQQVIESRAPLLINQNFMGLAMQSKNPLLTGAWPKSALFVPLLVKGKVRSIISIQDLEHENAYTASDVQLLQTLANSMSVALENARLFGETQQRNAELAILNSVGEAMSKTLDVKTVTKIVGDKVRDIFSADQMGILLFEKQTNLIHVLYGYDKAHNRYLDSLAIKPLPLGKGLTSKVIELRQPLLLSTREEQDEYGHYMPPELAGQIKMSESWLGVPIMVEEEVLGTVFVEDYRSHAYTESHMRLLQTLSTNMGVAIQNARLFDETQKRNAELAVINSIQAGLASNLDMQAIYNLIGEKIRDIFKAESVAINYYDQEHDLISTPYLWSQGKRLANEEPTPLSDSPLRKSMIESRESWMINRDTENIPKLLHAEPDEQLGRWPKSGIGTPIVASDKVIGIIQIVNMEQENTYTDADLHLLEIISNSMSVALENAHLFDETQHRNAELAIINSVQEGLASKLEMQEIYELVGEKLSEIFDYQDVGIYSTDLKTHMITIEYAIEKGHKIERITAPLNSLYEYIISANKYFVFNGDYPQFASQFANYQVIAGELPKSVLAVPVPRKRDMDLAVYLVLEDVDGKRFFSASDVRLLQTLASSMSVALENARLWEQEKLFRKALQRELEIGREIQQGFLPDVLPRVEGWEIAASLMSAREVAGDFYDAFELPDGTLGLVIADVCDKGVGAALFMTLFRSLIRAAANLDYFEQTENADALHSSVERLQRAVSLTNNYIAETHGDSGMFATLFFGILDPRNGKFIYINGGHESPLILRADAVRESLCKTGPAVGAIPNCKFDILEAQLQAGDTFFAFTDGVTDCQNPRGEFFGRERLHDLLRKCHSAHGLVDAIQSDLRQYIDSASQFDDITLLAVRRLSQFANL